MSQNNKKVTDNKSQNSFKKRSFNLAFAPQEILANPNRPDWLYASPENIDLIFLDFETTGGNPLNSSIIEIGAIKYSKGKEVGRFETLIKPRHNISKIVQKITGINNAMVENSPTFEDIAASFFEFIGDCPIVAHGAIGDIAFVYQHYKEIFDKELQNYYFCTHLLVSHFLPNIPSKTLSGVAKYFNIPELPAHKAINDAKLSCDVFWKLTAIFQKHGFNQCLDLLKIQADNETLKKLGPGINPNLAESIPTTSGVVFLTNSDQEIAFVTATQNIRKTYNKLTSISVDRELNKIIAHVEGFKYERAINYLDALLKENNLLKKITLNVDPRKVQNRCDSFVQIFIPEELLEYASNNSQEFAFPARLKDDSNQSLNMDDYVPIQTSSESESFLLSFNNQNEKISINKARKSFISPQSKKFLMSRKRPDSEVVVESGYLKEGVGYFFGPFEKPKEIKEWIKSLILQLPFDNKSISMNERFLYLKILISYLNGSMEDEILNLENHIKSFKFLKNIFQLPFYLACLRKAKLLSNKELLITKNEFVKSGLAVITNNELKEFEIIVVVKGIIIKKLRLPIEQSDKLKSSRYFTRLFEKSYNQIKSIYTPIVFTENSCADLELFSYWLHHKSGEGEWSEFHELEALYDDSIL